MSHEMSLKEQVQHLILYARNSKNLDNVVEEMVNFVRGKRLEAIKDFLSNPSDKERTKLYEAIFSKGQGKTITELSKR